MGEGRLVQKSVAAEARRIGEAQNPGPGKQRTHKRGKRFIDGHAARQARHYFGATETKSKDENVAVYLDAKNCRGSRQDSLATTFLEQCLIIWHLNIQRLRSHAAELVGRIRMATEAPHILCLNETFLDHTIGGVDIEGYVMVERWDRPYERGGVCIYAADCIAQKVTPLFKSEKAERIWCMLHTDQGPYLLGAWYRPPSPEVTSIEACEREHDDLTPQVIGTLLVGDLNVHHIGWLKHSNSTSACGKRLRFAAAAMNLKQLVREPTRGKHLLDLALSDIAGASSSTLPKIADHRIVEVRVPVQIPEVEMIEREVWKFATADWERLDALLQFEDWSVLSRMDADRGARHLSETLLQHANCCIQKKRIVERKSTHPWLNDAVLRAVAEKRDAEGTASERDKNIMCSRIVMQEYNRWVAKVHNDLVGMKQGSKSWWKWERQLQLQKQRCSSIPALKLTDGTWTCDNKEKANALANTLANKYKLADLRSSNYSDIDEEQLNWLIDRGRTLHPLAARDIMKKLREDSAMGPDLVPTRIIKHCASSLAVPVYLLAMTILATGRWPDLYTIHWVACLHKKKSVCDPNNYRGVHMTAQFAKVLERFIGLIFLPVLTSPESIGKNQFAYVKERGARDAVAYLVLAWLAAFKEKASIALYMSDVSGAFDRVSASRLLSKLRAKGIPEDLLKVIQSWLRKRRAQVIVGGEASDSMALENMVFQGTVWGPTLWNSFYADSRRPIRMHDFSEIIFADDLNAWKKFGAGTEHHSMIHDMKRCQKELHKWGAANQVSFDKDKEGMYILSRRRPHGEDFKLLGIHFDCKLVMSATVEELAKSCRWKMKALLRTSRFNTGAALINLYKAQLLSYIEYRTAAIYHVCDSALALLDVVQDKVLRIAGMTKIEALNCANLAPLSVRRDIAMLGVIHRAAIGRGPEQLRYFFEADEDARRENRGRHRLQLKMLQHHGSDFVLPRSEPAQYIEYSAFGLIAVYNLLPADIVEASPTVREFQRALQSVVRQRANAGCSDWEVTLSPRRPLYRHPLRGL